MKAYCSAEDLALYVADRYSKKKKGTISKLKLQKSLYFLFAYWGGFVVNAKNADGVLEDESFKDLPLHLFEDKIEAWVYGPVIRSVYSKYENVNFTHTDFNKEKAIKNISKNETVKEFIDDLLDDLFAISDFKLVELSHQDKCWQKCYNENDPSHNVEIPKDLIIEEYAKK